MADCQTVISRNITSDCTTIGSGGIETKVWLLNRTDIASITYNILDYIVEAITMKTGKRAWVLTGFKKNLNAGHDKVVADDVPDKFTHYFNFKNYEFLGLDIQNVDNLSDIVAIYESKDKTTTGEGVFRILGLSHGLFSLTDTMRVNENSGARNIELQSLAGQEEPKSMWTFFKTSYATTLGLIEDLETPAI